MGPNSIDDIDCSSFFDQIDDLIEFPADGDCLDINVGGNLVNSANDAPSAWTTGELQNPNAIFAANSSASDISAELSVPFEEIAQLEWLSTFVEDSFADHHKDEIPCLGNKDPKVNNNFQTSSPISVLESSSSSSNSSGNSSSSIAKTAQQPPTLCGTQRARSKRPRPPAFSPRAPMTAPPTTAMVPLVESSSSRESKKKKGKKGSGPGGEGARDCPPPAPAARKCLHCEITKTPQWRAGPMGPKTLCNACGVRFKSGRLFPEYRPAASPTFVPAVHSNSHKRVLEMRNKAGHGGNVGPAYENPQPELEGLVTE